MSLPLARGMAIIGAMVFVLAPLECAGEVLAQRPVTRISLEKSDFLSALLALAMDTGVRMGVELLPDEGNQEINFKAAGSTLGVELDKLMQSDPRYEWKQVSGVIDILPKGGSKSVFDVVVDHFETKNAFPMQMLQELIRDPGIAAYLSKRKITPNTLIAGSVPTEQASLDLQRVTFREALNRILLATQRLGWTAIYRHEKQVDYLWFQLL